MKNLLLGTLLTISAGTIQADTSVDSNKDYNQVLESIQMFLDDNNIDCRIKLQPIRNVARYVVNQTFKFKAGCEDQTGTKLNGTIKLKSKEHFVVIKKLSLTLKNVVIPK